MDLCLCVAVSASDRQSTYIHVLPAGLGGLDALTGAFCLSMAQAKKTGKEGKGASADKRNFFATMSADVIKAIKQAALEHDTTASSANGWLERRKKK
jgi:hypothetical protein